MATALQISQVTPKPEQRDADLFAEENSQQNHESRKYPNDENSLVKYVVESEAHVRHQFLHTAHILLHCQREGWCHELLWDELRPEPGRTHPWQTLIDW